MDHNEEHWVNPRLLHECKLLKVLLYFCSVVINKQNQKLSLTICFVDACDLTFDPNTMNEHLVLSECNRKVDFTQEKQPYPDHPERFNEEHQVLCREGLTGRCYWEVEWEGLVDIGVAYKSLERKGLWNIQLKVNSKAWCFCIYGSRGYSFYHSLREVFKPVPIIDVKRFLARQKRLGLFLDWSAGILCFYSLSGDTKTLLHTFHTTFSEPLYPAFNVFSSSSLTLSKVAKPKVPNVSIKEAQD